MESLQLRSHFASSQQGSETWHPMSWLNRNCWTICYSESSCLFTSLFFFVWKWLPFIPVWNNQTKDFKKYKFSAKRIFCFFRQLMGLYYSQKKPKDFSSSSVFRRNTTKDNCSLFQNIPCFVFLPLLRVSVFYSPLPCAEYSPWWVGCSYYAQAVGENSVFFLGHSKILAVLKGSKNKQNQMHSQIYLLLFDIPHLHGNVRLTRLKVLAPSWSQAW